MTLKLQGTNTVAAPGVSNDGNDGVVVGTDSIELSIAGASKAKLNSAGNFVLGGSSNTTDQGYRFTLQGSSNATYFQLFDSTTGTTHGSHGTLLGLINGDAYFYNREAKSMIFGTSNNERFRIESGGHLQIPRDRYLGTVGDSQSAINIGTSGGSQIGFHRINTNDDDIRFYTHVSGSSHAERVRITNDGVFCVGGTVFGAAGALTIKPNYDDGAAQIITERANTSNVSIVWEMKNNGGQVGRIEHDNTSAALISGSDYRLKENDVAISDGITRVKQLRPIRFNWKAEPSKTVDGFFAHEVQSIVPEAVSGEKDAVDEDDKIIMQGMVTERLVPLLTAALKEAIGKIEVLETKVAALEGS